MLTKLEVRNRQGTLLVLPFEDVESGLIIEEITGLDPVKATIVTSTIAGQDGVQAQSSKREQRTIGIKIGLEADYVDTSIRSLRQRLYSFLMPKTEVSLRFYEDLGSYVDIQATVEDFNAPLFTQDPEANVTLQCFDPDFIDPDSFDETGLTVSGSDVTMTTIPYYGSVESGMLFTMSLDRNCTYFTVVHQAPNGTVYQLDFAADMLAGDEVKISTITGAKGATRKRDGVIESVLYGVSPASKWLELEPGPGDNLIRVTASAAGIPWKVEYVTRYGGL